MDDVLIFRDNQQVNDTHLIKVLERVQSAEVTLNSEKCELCKPSLKFLGLVIDKKNGVRADPEKTDAISRMTPPTFCV